MSLRKEFSEQELLLKQTPTHRVVTTDVCFLISLLTQVTVDDFFLRYLGTEGLVLELNQARAADFELVGRRQIALSGLLSSKPRIVLQREPLISTRDGAVVCYVHVEVLCSRWSGRRSSLVVRAEVVRLCHVQHVFVFSVFGPDPQREPNLSLVTLMYFSKCLAKKAYQLLSVKNVDPDGPAGDRAVRSLPGAAARGKGEG